MNAQPIYGISSPWDIRSGHGMWGAELAQTTTEECPGGICPVNPWENKTPTTTPAVRNDAPQSVTLPVGTIAIGAGAVALLAGLIIAATK